ncbi:MAG: DUF4007 family protein [Chloroflexi bacterium]|nr:DUF4007 family protein [Chloroflexota bacterium]
MNSPFDRDTYRPRLSGHETFPLRYGWLKKAYDSAEGDEDCSALFASESAIARFGVGKNMVAAIRYWAVAAGVLEERQGLRRSVLGRMIFADAGLDPWMEEPATSWLAHWHIAGRPHLTTWYWAFNHYSALAFERDGLVRGVSDLASRRRWPRASIATIRRDVGCFVRAYATPYAGPSTLLDDVLESPLAELGLIRATGRRDGFRFVRGPKPTLDPAVVCYAISNFWRDYAPDANTLSYEALAYAGGSPGRVFVLGEDDLVLMLASMGDLTRGVYRWSETAGLKQLIRERPLAEDEARDLVRIAYRAVTT